MENLCMDSINITDNNARVMEKINLSSLKKNETGVIHEICGGCIARSRLCELGLNKGTFVQMIKNDIGPLILNIQGHKLALGKGLGSKIIIER